MTKTFQCHTTGITCNNIGSVFTETNALYINIGGVLLAIRKETNTNKGRPPWFSGTTSVGTAESPVLQDYRVSFSPTEAPRKRLGGGRFIIQGPYFWVCSDVGSHTGGVPAAIVVTTRTPSYNSVSGFTTGTRGTTQGSGIPCERKNP